MIKSIAHYCAHGLNRFLKLCKNGRVDSTYVNILLQVEKQRKKRFDIKQKIIATAFYPQNIFRRASASKTMDNLKVEPGSQKESADHTGTNKGMTLKTGTGTGTSFLETKIK